jgi:hypothetical protein
MTLYTPIVTSAETVHTGVAPGDYNDRMTKKRIWLDSEMRMIEDTYTNRNKAYEVDALARLIINVQTYTILGRPHLTSNDNNKYEPLLTAIKERFDALKLMPTLRGSIANLKKDGRVYFQKHYADGTIAKTETRPLKSIHKLEHVEKYENPSNPSDYYLFQNLLIADKWQNPTSSTTRKQRVWYIKGGEEEASKNVYIKRDKDIVVDLADILEVQNNESGESSLTACLTEIFIKHLIFMNFPNLVNIVVSPGVMFSHPTTEEDGVQQPPDTRMAESNPTEYEHQLTLYNDFKSNMTTMLNNLEADWMHKGIVSKPNNITAEIMESSQALNAEMLDTMLDRLNREISFALGFPLSLLDAKGVELSTSRNILSTMNIVMKGIQDQYVALVQTIIENQFPEAKDAGIVFSFSELDPKDAKDLATIEKLHASIIKIYKEIGASDADIKALSSKYDILDDADLGGSGIVKSEAIIPDEYSEADIVLAGRSIAQIMEDADEEKEAAAVEGGY